MGISPLMAIGPITLFVMRNSVPKPRSPLPVAIDLAFLVVIPEGDLRLPSVVIPTKKNFSIVRPNLGKSAAGQAPKPKP